jgi:antitoxin MazE
MARKGKSRDYAYSRTARVRGREEDGRYAVVQMDMKQSRVVRRLPDGRAPGPGIVVATEDLIDLKETRVVPTGQRRTITIPGELCRDLGIEEGVPIELTKEAGRRLSLQPLERTPSDGSVANLNDLLARVTRENLHGEVSTGDAVGQETW